MLLLIPSGFNSAKINVNRDIEYIGQLMTPRTWGMNKLTEYPLKWGGDNDCFTGNFDPAKFTKWLDEASPYKERCLFITCPDVVGEKDPTLKLFSDWRDTIKSKGYPVALVLQDNITSKEIPWDKLDAVFLGGSTKWKCLKKP